MLRSLFTTLSAISARLQQFVDEESTIPTSVVTIQGAALVGTVTAVATTMTNQRPVFSTSAPRIEIFSRPEPTLPIFHNIPDHTYTEVQVVIDHGATDAPHPLEE